MPREVLREMGELGFFSLRVPEALGGAGPRCARLGRAGRGGRPLDPWRLRHHRAGAYRHGEPASGPLRHQAPAREVPAGRDGRHQPSPRSASPSPAPAPTSPAIRTRAVRDGDALRAERRQDVHHQRRAWRSLLHRRAHRSRGQGQPRHHHVHRREGHAGLPRRPRARQDRLALLRHRRAGVRGLPRAGRERAGRAQPRLLLDHGQLPDRAAGDRRHGDGRGARGDPAHLRLCQPAHRVRRAAVGEAGDPPAPVAPAGRGRGGAPARASHGVARCPGHAIAWPRSRWSRRWPATW